ncbi:hypothetical protein IA57_11955 [Mangrovimonas yunxiaonensis]|uniref:Uncharacterized protein n=1 Tax=Mangrovimonas yunxiaonensis TaxID=1197477 RepID=A0A084THF4_9FLAO|nr:hypothetical protein IA57_11955 [Mangrovimonas yunxiaonensis]GGH42108.1 hypothetical protein GCM10011364_13410 [Mangrovimonas yunxiaonensis]
MVAGKGFGVSKAESVATSLSRLVVLLQLKNNNKKLMSTNTKRIPITVSIIKWLVFVNSYSLNIMKLNHNLKLFKRK